MHTEIYILTYDLWATRLSPSNQPDSHHILGYQMPAKESITNINQLFSQEGYAISLIPLCSDCSLHGQSKTKQLQYFL